MGFGFTSTVPSHFVSTNPDQTVGVDGTVSDPTPTPQPQPAKPGAVSVEAHPANVEVHDHSSSNPANWSTQQWMDAIKRDPERYGKLFTEMSLNGQISSDVDETKMGLFVQQEMQTYNRHISLLSEMQQAIHETRKSIHIQV